MSSSEKPQNLPENRHSWVVTPEDLNGETRLDQFIVNRLGEGCSRSTVSRWIKEGQVEVHREDQTLKARPALSLRPDLEIILTIPPVQPLDLTAWDHPLEILHEDDDLLVLVKPVGVAVHPGPGHPDKTLVNMLIHHTRGKERLSQMGDAERPGIVHRLDLPTHGLMVVAKHNRAHWHLAEQFARREVGKYYRSIVTGTVRPAFGEIEQPIGRHPSQRAKMAVRRDGRPAQSLYRTHFSWRDPSGRAFSYLHVRILTGRTHQIRVHLAHLGFPVVADTMYSKSARKFKNFPLMLSCFRLEFAHPADGRTMKFHIAPPEHFWQFLRGRGAPVEELEKLEAAEGPGGSGEKA